MTKIVHSINDEECNDRRVDDMGRNRKKLMSATWII